MSTHKWLPEFIISFTKSIFVGLILVILMFIRSSRYQDERFLYIDRFDILVAITLAFIFCFIDFKIRLQESAKIREIKEGELAIKNRNIDLMLEKDKKPSNKSKILALNTNSIINTQAIRLKISTQEWLELSKFLLACKNNTSEIISPELFTHPVVDLTRKGKLNEAAALLSGSESESWKILKSTI